MVSVIVSVGENGEIGRGGDLCWHIREDLQRFKNLTMGHRVVMGRKTWESLPRRPLPGRENVVITRSDKDSGEFSGAIRASSLQDALSGASADPVYIIGGASVYQQAMPIADTLEITRILAADPEADTYFPEIDEKTWNLESRSEEMTSENGLRFRYETYRRRR